MINKELFNRYFNDINIEALINKDIYIWGIGVFGISVLSFFKECNINIKGVIDKNASNIKYILGNKCYTQDVLEQIKQNDSIFIVTATKPQSIKIITGVLNNYGFDNYVILSDTKTVQIDISGVCNLRCKSCPVGNETPEAAKGYKNRGYMTPETFETIIRKLKKEMPSIKCINLYIFGDPMLSPYLPQILEICRKYNLFSIVSTNLSMQIDLEKILKSTPPSCIKISISGYSQEIYQTTHNNGNINLVKSNMYKIKYLIEKYKVPTCVVVGYHIYTNNADDEYRKMQNLCEELGFLFQPTEAIFCNHFKRMGLEPFSEEDVEFISKYYKDSETILNCLPRTKGKQLKCGLLDNGLFIDFDGRVLVCCGYRRDDAVLPFNYIDTPLKLIQQERRKSYICRECVAHNLEWQ